ncbi:Holin-X, holin superfamily III [Vibrio crassostreae]|uniref:hypothetical protein n=1 Tax=Vibrio crassostreae TaxID=246167 RepID=UPI0006303D06|nr:hypothetical protein [Vibrio crassostreae]CAK2945265.1 Holin-X, holin superfamily III [Vibrio crassostreae]CAK3892354.1 Holin-X, holin superfamily III [Vibrio crassostreae]CDT46024.1 conserved membrane hypothetical protein [Vibrio crassostreae]
MSNKEKEVEFYAATVGAWLNTKFELDKSLLTLSTGAIGLLVTLLTTVGASSVEGLVLYFVALLSFLVCVVSILFVFKRNAKHLEGIVTETQTNDPLLKSLDTSAAISFVFGVILTLIIGGTTAINQFIEKEMKMTKEVNKTIHNVAVGDSINGLEALRPARKEEASVEGIINMKPQQKPEPTKIKPYKAIKSAS